MNMPRLEMNARKYKWKGVDDEILMEKANENPKLKEIY